MLLLETFVDPARFHGTVYRAANWTCLGLTQGFRRTRDGYSADAPSPKLAFILPVQRDARAQLSRSILDPIYRTGAPRIMLTAQQMRTLPEFFNDIPDPRRAEGRRHRLPVVLGIAAGATLCGMRGYKAIAEWAKDLKPKARERFGCRRENKQCIVPSESIIRDVLIRVDPVKLDLALQQWNMAFAKEDKSLAIDGKTMCNAIDEAGHPGRFLIDVNQVPAHPFPDIHFVGEHVQMRVGVEVQAEVRHEYARGLPAAELLDAAPPGLEVDVWRRRRR